ncbi:MAG TPA: glycosyltransferase family 9 protein [Candidatus Aquilonibacter sp.]
MSPAAGVGDVRAVILAAVMPLTSPSVLLIRLDAIGDALALTPLLAALHARAIPVDLVMRSVNAELFSSRAARTIYVAPFALRSSTRSNLREIREFGMRLRENGYSDTLVATEDPGGYRLAQTVGSKHRVGFVNGWGKPFKTIWASRMLTRSIVRTAGLDPRAPHECDVLWQLGKNLAGDVAIPRDPSVLRPLILESDVPRGERIAFQVSDKWERLGIDLAQVVLALRSAAQVGEVHAIAASSESPYAQRVEAASGVTVERFAALPPWKEAIANAAAIVTPDSGAAHVAGMVGTPTVVAFPPTRDFDLQLARWAPWAAPYRALRAEGTWPDQVAPALHALLDR